MDLVRPAGEYAEPMLEPGGWPDANETAFYDRAHEYTLVLRDVTQILETCQHQQTEVFDQGVWSGSAAVAANAELVNIIGALTQLQSGLATVITWQRYVAGSIIQAKSLISDNVDSAHEQINALEHDSSLNAAARTTAIGAVVGATHHSNVDVVAGAAEQIVASKAWKPPNNALKELLDQKIPPLVTLPAAPISIPANPVDEQRPRPSPAPPTPTTPTPSVPGRSPQSPPSPPSTEVIPQPGPGPSPTPERPVTTPRPVPDESRPTMPGTPGIAPSIPQPPAIPTPQNPAAPAVPGAPAAGHPPAAPGTPAAGHPPAAPPTSAAPGTPVIPGAPASPAGPAVPANRATPVESPAQSEGGKGVAAASAHSSGSRSQEESSQSVAPASATGMPAAPIAPASGGASAGSGARSAAPAGQSSSTSPATRPAAVARAAPRPASAARSKSSDKTESADAAAAPPIPVSATRAERDAIADAARRQSDGADPLRLARRIAAALNAPGSGGEVDFGFFWVTAVTTDGKIVVANSYGLAYIPDGVQLPEQVLMASADESVPVVERARWATYPMMALQAWAAHHHIELRAVIATGEQFANSDPGVAKVVLTQEDIPDTGAMVGRSRLKVVDSGAADRLEATPDLRLVGLLPPASADARPATDERAMLWFEVLRPMTSSAAGRETAHLLAFRTYAAHAREVSLGQAHSAVDQVAQRHAVADWLYWSCLAGLLDAVAADAPKSVLPQLS